MSEPARLAVVTVAGLSFAICLLLTTGTVDAHRFITPGALGPAADIIAEDFGTDALDADGTGYDGQQTYAIARYFPHLDEASPATDRPRYRMLRILPPALASIAPPGTATVLALLGVNLVGLGLAVWATGRLMEQVGAAAWAAVPACSVLLIGVVTTTVGPIAWGLALVAIDQASRGRLKRSAMIFVVAALCRETTIVAAFVTGAALLPTSGRDRRTLLFGLPALVVVGWYLLLGELVPGDVRTPTNAFGFLELSAGDAITPGLVALLGLIGAWAWRDRLLLALPSLVFTVWVALYAVEILHPLAISRVNALPMILGILGILRMATARDRPKHTEVGPVEQECAEPGPC